MRFDGHLDPTNRKLLALLRANGRQSATALGKELGLSRTAVQDRIYKLEQQNIITGYQAIINTTAQENVTRAILSIRIDSRSCAPVLKRLQAMVETIQCYSTAGPTDAVVIVETATSERLTQLLDEISQMPDVGDVQSTVVLAQMGG